MTVMTKSRAKAEQMAKRKRPPGEAQGRDGGKPLAIQVRGSTEWKAWVERLAEFDRSNVADLTDRAMAAYARTIGFLDPPPPR